MKNLAALQNRNVAYFTTVDANLRAFWLSCKPPRDADPDFTTLLVEATAVAFGMRCLVIRDGVQPKAMLVGRLELTAPSVKIGYLRAPIPVLRTLVIPNGGWLGELDEMNAVIFIDSLKRLLAKGEVEAVQFHGIELKSPLAREALSRPSFLCRDRAITLQIRRFRELAGDGKGFSASLSSNERYQQRKRGRKLAEQFGNVRIKPFRTPQETTMLMECAEEIARKSYQRGIGVGFSPDEGVRARLMFQAEAGWLRGFVLFLDDQPAAFWIGALREHVYCSDYLAFDPDFGNFAPGMYLMLEVMETLMRDPDAPARYIDFGGGDSDYKRRLGNAAREEAIISIFAPRPRAIAANLMRSALGWINPWMKRRLTKRGWLTAIKRSWRLT